MGKSISVSKKGNLQLSFKLSNCKTLKTTLKMDMKHINIISLVMGVIVMVCTFSWARWWRDDIRQILVLLEWLTPAASAISMLAVLVLVVVCRSHISGLVRLLKRRDWLLLGIVILIAMVLRIVLIPATERVYYDEHTYLQIARGIADEGRARVASYGVLQQNRYQCRRCSYPHWPAGWPTLLAIALRLMNYARWTGSIVNLFLSFSTVVLVALITASLFPSKSIWQAAAAIFACLPANQVWSRTSAAEVFGVFAATFAVMCAIRFSQAPSRRFGYLLAASIALATQVRNEMVLLIPVYGLFIVSLGGVKALKEMRWPAIVLVLFLIPQSLHLGYISRSYQPGIEGAGFSLRYFSSNIMSVAGYLYKEPVSLLILIPAFLGSWRSFLRKAVLPLWVWGFSAFLLPMFHFGGSYAYPGGERFLLAWMPAIVIMAGSGFYVLHAMIARYLHQRVLAAVWLGIFFCILLWAGPHAASEDRGTRIPREDSTFLRNALRSVPEDGIVVTADPPTVIAEGRSAIFILWAGSNMQRLQQLGANWKDKIYFFVSPSSLPSYWPGGEECEKRLLSMFQAKVVKQQKAPEGLRVLYKLLPTTFSE